MKGVARKQVGALVLLGLIGALMAQLAMAQETPRLHEIASDTTDSDTDGDGVLDCAPGVMIHSSAGFIGIGEPAPTKTGAIANYLSDERRASGISSAASDFSEYSVGEGGGVTWVSEDRQVVTVLEQDAKREWFVVARSMCTDVVAEK